jgi:hypothetical protein
MDTYLVESPREQVSQHDWIIVNISEADSRTEILKWTRVNLWKWEQQLRNF